MIRFGVAGPGEACADRARGFGEAGADYVVLEPACELGDWPRQLAACGELIATLGAGQP